MINAKVSITYVNKNGESQVFTPGDDVICCIGDKTYIGKIVYIGELLGNNVREECSTIYIDDTKSGGRFCSKTIKASEITYMCKFPNTKVLSKDKQKELFTEILKKLGYGGETVFITNKIMDILSEVDDVVCE